ncbi:hypothetical protein [Dyadobacter tibetensis]|uniref:hypothetical protein n=1 Tax=Dyadobacter tibetensis TaxID=1211851 RepID=UPI0004717C94|nr:hypothetical protein [Dyadobacter tibetensis]
MEPNSELQHNDYSQGYTNGLEGLERHTYEAYLKSQSDYEWLTSQIADRKIRLTQVQARMQENSVRQKQAFDRLQGEQTALLAHKTKLTEIELALDNGLAEQEILKKRREKNAPHYSLVAGLIFLVAGISFIAGDLIISHEIVAYALNIRNPNEAWAFAIGLAMLSVLLKPAYDRLIEGPYHAISSDGTQKRYARFKLILSIFAILTLTVLGWFRYEAYRTDKLKEAINKSVKNLQLNAIDPLTGTPIDSPEITDKIESALRESDQLSLTLVNSPWALLSFVLSGVLFAVAGAVSLGMALPVLQAFWLRWCQIDPRLWVLQRRRKKLLRLAEPIRLMVARHGAEKSICENELKMLEPLWDIRTEEIDLKKELEYLEKEQRIAWSDSRGNQYADGYARGKVARDVMTEEEYAQWRRQHLSSANLAIKARSNTDTDRVFARSNKSPRLRPHQAIRKIISDRFDEDIV